MEFVNDIEPWNHALEARAYPDTPVLSRVCVWTTKIKFPA
ncbi:hypothetical protein ALC62_11779 [Cyphomyrmex costatus]|uniref:Uncharacterized protein n=1 Tax=Cyphomyrmex costatus TaxID=456900 RepID=A0A195C9J0_9HYME|nr:hypothetical protein ALC62_11779 [Cyphomyrmex costatus]